MTRLPYRFSASEVVTPRSAPTRGEHNAEVLGELLGVDDARLRELEELGAVLQDTPEER